MMILGTLAIADLFIQLLGFGASYGLDTDNLYDITGEGSFIILSTLSYCLGSMNSRRQALVTSMICLWAIRLGCFLGVRIIWYGADPRLNKVKPKPLVFLLYWIIQGVWVIVTSLPVHLVNDNPLQPDLGFLDYFGVSVWTVGFLMETFADYHKFYFRLTHNNKKDFVKTGLWRYSRHPNYFGEIILWWGVFFTCYSGLGSFAMSTAISPIFVTYLLGMVSGLPLLEKQNDIKYAEVAEYQAYRAKTPVLVPDFRRLWPKQKHS